MLNHLYALSIKVRNSPPPPALTGPFFWCLLILLNGSLVLSLGWRDGAERHPPLQEEIRHHVAVQAHMKRGQGKRTRPRNREREELPSQITPASSPVVVPPKREREPRLVEVCCLAFSSPEALDPDLAALVYLSRRARSVPARNTKDIQTAQAQLTLKI